MKRKIDNFKIAYVGILSAISIVFALLIRFPIFPSAPFLEYDAADVPILICTFMYGPWTGLLMTGIVCVLQGVTVSASSGIIGIAMHFFATGSYVITAGLIYRRFHTLRGALIALLSGIVVWTVVMIPLNLIFTPLYGTPIEAVISMILPVIVPFNLIKASINSAATFLLYKRLHTLFLFIERKISQRKKKQPVQNETKNDDIDRQNTQNNE